VLISIFERVMRSRITELEPRYVTGKSLREGGSDFTVIFFLYHTFVYLRSESFDYSIGQIGKL
jgi:hypothetical protein